jgi:hypothetical protein
MHHRRAVASPARDSYGDEPASLSLIPSGWGLAGEAIRCSRMRIAGSFLQGLTTLIVFLGKRHRLGFGDPTACVRSRQTVKTGNAQ